MTVRRSWIIGAGADCDLVVDRLTISGHHCRLAWDGAGFVLEDLGSTNGTWVNGRKISGLERVVPDDAISLGTAVPMPWPDLSFLPPPEVRVIRIGRDPQSDVVVDRPTISWHHARIVLEAGGATIEDLGSANGTFVDSFANRVSRAPLRESDTVYFGSFAVPASQLLSARTAHERRPLPSNGLADWAPTGPSLESSGAGRHDVTANLPTAPGAFLGVDPDHGVIVRSWLAQFERIARRTADGKMRAPLPMTVFLVQAPLIAAAIVLVNRAAGPSAAGTTFALAVSAIWLGGTAAILDTATAPPDFASELADLPGRVAFVTAKLTLLGVLATACCAVVLGIVHAGDSLRGPYAPMLGILGLTAEVGLALGLLVSIGCRGRMPAWVVSSLVFAGMVLLGGAYPPFAKQAPLVRSAGGLLPARWAFEGLLILEQGSLERVAVGPDPPDLVERFFPARTQRMGVRADVIALTAMAIGSIVGLVWTLESVACRSATSGATGREDDQCR